MIKLSLFLLFTSLVLLGTCELMYRKGRSFGYRTGYVVGCEKATLDVYDIFSKLLDARKLNTEERNAVLKVCLIEADLDES